MLELDDYKQIKKILKNSVYPKWILHSLLQTSARSQESSTGGGGGGGGGAPRTPSRTPVNTTAK